MKKVKLSDRVTEKAKSLNNNAQFAQAKLSAYLQGCMDTLKLKGNWNYNAATNEFEQMEDK